MHSCHVVHSFQLILMLFVCMCVCVCVCINCIYLFIVFFFECVGVLPFDGEIKMYIMARIASTRSKYAAVHLDDIYPS